MLFYTYIWRDADGIPFYVGKGKGRRAWSTNAAHRSAEFKSIHSQGGCAVEIVDEFILESQAHAHEIELIALYGRREFGGLLINRTDGGEGASGLVHGPEARAKMRSAQSNRSPEHIANLKLSAHAWSPEAREKLRQSRLGKIASAETRRKISGYSRNRSPETRAKIGALSRQRSSESNAKIAEGHRKNPPNARNTSGFKGVSLIRPTGKWDARIWVGGIQVRLGHFQTAEAAARAYDSAAIDAWGIGNCYLNFEEEAARALAR